MPDFLDHVDLEATGLQDDVEFGLLLCGATGVAQRAGHHDRATGGGFDAVLVLQDGLQFLGFQKGEADDLFGEFLRSAI